MSQPARTLSSAAQRKIFDEFAKKIGIQKQEDWYSKNTQEEFANFKKELEESTKLFPSLCNVYPEYEWVEWGFPKSWGSRVLATRDKQLAFMEWVAPQLGIHTQEDWYNIHATHLVV